MYVCLLFAPKEPQLCGGMVRWIRAWRVQCVRSHTICFYTANMPAICTMCVCVSVFNIFLYKDIHQRKWIESVVWIALENECSLHTAAAPLVYVFVYTHSYIHSQTNKYTYITPPPPRSPIQIFLESRAQWRNVDRRKFCVKRLAFRISSVFDPHNTRIIAIYIYRYFIYSSMLCCVCTFI